MPTISVVTPVFNGEKFLPSFFKMLQEQSFTDFEVIVVDDGSTDASADLVRGYLADDRVHLVCLPENAGAAAARNAGLERARGRHVCFLDVDDSWRADKLKLQLEFMESSGCALSYMDYERVDASGRVLSRVLPPERADFGSMLKSNRIGNLTAMVRRDALAGISFKSTGHEDYVFWLQVLRRTGSARKATAAEIMCSYTVRDGSLSANKLKAAGWQWQIYRSVLGLNRASAAWYMAHYIAISINKRL